VTLVSHEGLGIIPRTILEQGTWTVAQYLLDLFKSKDADPDFRTKLMVVGYENVGKSTLLDCLFPLEGLSVAHGVRKKSKLFRLHPQKTLTMKCDEMYRKNQSVPKVTGLALFGTDYP